MSWIDIEERLPSTEGVYDCMFCDNETLEFSFGCCLFSNGRFIEGRDQEVIMWMARK